MVCSTAKAVRSYNCSKPHR